MHTIHTASTTPIADAGPARPRPGLALLLALLAVPGSTVAWDLPSGGLWIGLPLAVAAIVLGLRARRARTGTGRGTAAVVLAGLCIAQMAVWTAVSVADARPHEQVRFHEHDVDLIDGYCGDLQVRTVFDTSGVIVGRTTGPDGALRYTVSNHGEGTVTNLATGKAFTITYDYTVQDVRVTVNDDGTVSILAQVPGPEKIYGPDGQLLHTSGGTFRELVVIDYGGTLTDLDDDTFVSAEVVSENGGRPQSGPSFCELFHDLTA